MFFENVLTAGEQVIILYVIVAIGFISDKVGFFTEKVAKSCTDLLFYVVTSAKIVESFYTLEYTPETAKKLFIALGCGLLLHLVSAGISTFVFNRCPSEKACIFKYASAYGNCGYMALPLANAVLGDEGVFYCSAVIISFQMFTFTHGVYIINKGNPDSKVKFDWKKLILNPGVLSVMVGLPIFLLSIDLPDIVTEPITYVASLNSPLAMLIFGTYIANTNFKSIFREWRILGVAAIKLLILPAIMLVGLHLVGINGALLVAITLSASAPPATNTAIFAAKYGRDTGLASQTVASVSFMSILTMPVMIAAAQLL